MRFPGLLRFGYGMEVVLRWWGRGVGKWREFSRAVVVVVVKSQAICAFYLFVWLRKVSRSVGTFFWRVGRVLFCVGLRVGKQAAAIISKRT